MKIFTGHHKRKTKRFRSTRVILTRYNIKQLSCSYITDDQFDINASIVPRTIARGNKTLATNKKSPLGQLKTLTLQ